MRNRPDIQQILKELSRTSLAYFFPGFNEREALEKFQNEERRCEAAKMAPSDVMFSRTKRRQLTEADLFAEEDNDSGIRFSSVHDADIDIPTPTAPKMPEKPKGFLKSLQSMMPEPEIKDLPLDVDAAAVLAEIDALKAKWGISTLQLEQILYYKNNISRLTITKSRQILLTDYDNKEVRMDPLTKAVFLLYLKHPEGIRYKALSDHRVELTAIYESMTRSSNPDEIRKSIDRLVNPWDSNSINEKVSRVKKAFCDVIDDRIAQNYYITGAKGEPKRISLSRSLVVWE